MAISGGIATAILSRRSFRHLFPGSRSMLSLRAFLNVSALSALVLAAACADSTSAPVATGPGSPSQVRLVCTAQVAARTVSCAAPGAPAGVRADRIVGQGGGVKLASSNIAVYADTFAFDVTVTNQLEYPIGTTNGVNPDPNGIRPFFVDGIHTTGGTGSVTVANADGVGTFTATGQPYFAYPGVLQPAATTAPRRWKLRFDSGVETFAFSLYVSTPVPPGGGHVWMRVLQPAANAVVGDSVVVRVRVDSASASVQSVKAFAADRSVVLAPVSPGVVQGTLQLAGLPMGPLQLRVHAVTVRADTSDVVVPLTKDSPPALAVLAPRQKYVASPNLRIDANCLDDDPAGCTSVTATANRNTDLGNPFLAVIASGTTGIHTAVSLASLGYGVLVIEIKAVDSRGQARFQSDTVYVTSNPALVFVDSAGSGAMDLDSTRLLFSDEENRVWLRDRVTTARTLLAQAGNRPYGFLHAQGAIFATSSIDFASVYDWRSGTLAGLGSANSNSSLVAAGSWAIWNDGSTLRRRDLATGTTATVATNAINFENDVASNGDVVYSTGFGSGYDVVRYRAGVKTPVTNDPDDVARNLYPVTDGTNVLYLKTPPTGGLKGRVAWWDGMTETVLSDTVTVAWYAANGGWIAYPVVDGAGYQQVRTRAPDGTVRQVPTGSSPYGYLHALAPDGTVVYSTSSGTYVLRAPYTGSPTLSGGRPVFRGTELLVFLGNTVFRVSY
ncbi:MAG: hypothetical protein ACJ8GN_20845 [Longimicrobiaceae bacterium]